MKHEGAQLHRRMRESREIRMKRKERARGREDDEDVERRGEEHGREDGLRVRRAERMGGAGIDNSSSGG